MTGCIFDEIDQPFEVLSGEVVHIQIKITDPIVPEPNSHKGVFCVLAPVDWNFISGSYSFEDNSGHMNMSQAWGDSAEDCYPSQSFNENMNWIGLTSDSGYSYNEPIEIVINLEFQTGDMEGCFPIGYLATKATQGLICSGNQSWAPLSYPNPIWISTTEECELYSANSDSGWTGLFHRFEDWSGADGIYSIPFDGSEQINFNDNKTLLVFSDTFIGDVDSVSGHRISPTAIINNSYAILTGSLPSEENIEFYYSINEDGNPESTFLPQTENSQNGDWYWLMDGIAIEEKFYLFALRMDNGDNGNAAFAIDGVSLLTFNINDQNDIINLEQVETPLFYEDPEGWSVVYGQAIMSKLYESGSPDADEYVYFYGVKNLGGSKEMTVARVSRYYLNEFSQWRFWDGFHWTADISQSVSIGYNISQEFSVSQLSDGHYISTFQLNTVSDYTAYTSSVSPTGPFSNLNIVWSSIESTHNGNIYSYNAKAHPHLSTEESLLVSYNVNSYDFSDHFSNAGLYRPRFISIPKNDIFMEVNTSTSSSDYQKGSSEPILYPNPFNYNLNFKIDLSATSEIEITLYDLMGREIKSLFVGNGDLGVNNFTFKIEEFYNLESSTGIYFVVTRIKGKSFYNKVIFLK